jgi:hypothetical protein
MDESDARVFASIRGTGPDNGYTLTQIIAKASAINHGLLAEAEFGQAVPRMIAAGLVGAGMGSSGPKSASAAATTEWARDTSAAVCA